MDHLKKWFCSKHRKGKIDDQDYILTGTLIYELIRLYLTHGTCTPPKKSKIKKKKKTTLGTYQKLNCLQSKLLVKLDVPNY
jgi:hypothetical protein